jgi:hypothetical protein
MEERSLHYGHPWQSFFLRSVTPFGVSWEEWTIRWWKWILSIPIDMNPGIDPSGKLFSSDQPYREVIFLAGTFEGHARRTYFIPTSRAIFFPVINFITSFAEEPQLKTESDLVTRANEDIASLTNVNLSIDGISIKNLNEYRVQSPVFDILFGETNAFKLPPGKTRAISDGFWIFLRGLPSGWHTIHAIGSCYSGTTQESTTWKLRVG